MPLGDGLQGITASYRVRFALGVEFCQLRTATLFTDTGGRELVVTGFTAAGIHLRAAGGRGIFNDLHQLVGVLARQYDAVGIFRCGDARAETGFRLNSVPVLSLLGGRQRVNPRVYRRAIVPSVLGWACLARLCRSGGHCRLIP